jgi:predicted Fe-S protein YdhL (DUF1289 family)
MTDPIESPCTGLCQLDEHNVCRGCFRKMEEIIAWTEAEHDTRLQILQAAKQRKSEATE